MIIVKRKKLSVLELRITIYVLFDFENNVCHMSQSTFNTMMPKKNSFKVSLKILISSCNVIDDDDDDDDDFHTNLCFFNKF